MDPRNGIAHGENRRLDKTAYLNIHKRIVQIMDGLARQIGSAAVEKKYIKSSEVENETSNNEAEIPVLLG